MFQRNYIKLDFSDQENERCVGRRDRILNDDKDEVYLEHGEDENVDDDKRQFRNKGG